MGVKDGAVKDLVACFPRRCWCQGDEIIAALLLGKLLTIQHNVRKIAHIQPGAFYHQGMAGG